MAEDVAIDDPVLFADGALSGTVTDVRFSDNAPAEVDIGIEVGGGQISQDQSSGL